MRDKTSKYIEMVRSKTGLSDYKISKQYGINQSNLSKYALGKSSLSETHAWLFANILDLNPAEIVANTKLEHALSTGDKLKVKFWENQLNKISGMAMPIKIEIAQFCPIMGDIEKNAEKIIQLSFAAKEKNANLIVFPELALTGYPPEDLLFCNNFMQRIEQSITKLSQELPTSIMTIFGSPSRRKNITYNSAYCINTGRIQNIYHKRLLPNYGVFDEKRYFSSGKNITVFEYHNKKIGIIICEDGWYGDSLEKNYNMNVNLIISINASPFQIGKHQKRLAIYKQNAIKFNFDMLYVNLVGGQDQLVFDGGSFMINNKGDVIQQLPFFENLEQLHDKPCSIKKYYETELIYKALVLATKNYTINNGFNGALIGLSGGIDSALTLAIAVDALGAENISVVMMPYKFTSEISIKYAKEQALNQGVKYLNIDINNIVESFDISLQELFEGESKDITEENIQARVRGVLLMAISNKWHKLVLATGNKSELSVGYSTLYGDMCGGFAPLKDVNKTTVYELSKYRNTISEVIPKEVISRAPSAELAPNQTDQDSLPEYEELDKILNLFVEMNLSVNEISEQGYDKKLVKKVAKMVLNSEYKRRQSAIGPKISKNSFDKERRYPVTSKYQP